MKKIITIILMVSLVFLTGCNSYTDVISEVFNTKPYIGHISFDKPFYTSDDTEIKVLLKIKNPTNSDYSPVRLGVKYPEGVVPVDRDLRNDELIDLVSIKSNEEKSYFVAFNLGNNIENESLEFTFSIYNYNDQEFDTDKVTVEYTPNS